MTKLSRREFGVFSLAGVLTMSLFGKGCTVWSQIKAWVPVGISAFNAVLALLEGAGVITLTAGSPIAAIVGLITGGFSVLRGAIDTYLSTNPPPVGALQTVESILAAIIGNFQQFLEAVNLGSDTKLEALVTGFADIILSTIAGFQAELPQTAKVALRPFKLGRNGLPMQVAPTRRSVRQFKHDWNKLAKAYGESGSMLHESILEKVL